MKNGRLLSVLTILGALAGCAAPTGSSFDTRTDEGETASSSATLRVSATHLQLGGRRVDRAELARWRVASASGSTVLERAGARSIEVTETETGFVASDGVRRVRVKFTNAALGEQLLRDANWTLHTSSVERSAGGVQTRFIPLLVAGLVVGAILLFPSEANPPTPMEDPDLAGAVPVMADELQVFEEEITFEGDPP